MKMQSGVRHEKKYHLIFRNCFEQYLRSDTTGLSPEPVFQFRTIETYTTVLNIGFIIRPKTNIFVFQVSALKKLVMVGQHNILFCQNIVNRKSIFQYIFPNFPANLTTFCSQFTIKYLGSGQKHR